MTILKEYADEHNIGLKKAFVYAGVRDSTYYRAMSGKDLRHDTALKVSKALEKLAAKQSS